MSRTTLATARKQLVFPVVLTDACRLERRIADFDVRPLNGSRTSVAVMLAMNEYVTGQTINVNGGWYLS